MSRTKARESHVKGSRPSQNRLDIVKKYLATATSPHAGLLHSSGRPVMLAKIGLFSCSRPIRLSAECSGTIGILRDLRSCPEISGTTLHFQVVSWNHTAVTEPEYLRPQEVADKLRIHERNCQPGARRGRAPRPSHRCETWCRQINPWRENAGIPLVESFGLVRRRNFENSSASDRTRASDNFCFRRLRAGRHSVLAILEGIPIQHNRAKPARACAGFRRVRETMIAEAELINLERRGQGQGAALRMSLEEYQTLLLSPAAGLPEGDPLRERIIAVVRWH